MIIPLTEKQRAIIVGNTLGDGGIYSHHLNPDGKSSYFYIKQCNKYKEYIYWLYDELKNICPSEPKHKKVNDQWYFYSKSLENLTEIRKTFYLGKKKIVPKNIREWLTSPLSLAVWFMDDGGLDFRPKYHYSFDFSTNAFP